MATLSTLRPAFAIVIVNGEARVPNGGANSRSRRRSAETRYHEAVDPFSQATLGALVAHAGAGRQLGVRALAVGAGAGALPDIDVLFAIGGDYFDALVSHRGITHSLGFAPVVGPLLGWVVWRIEGSHDRVRLWRWVLALTAALFSHPLLDVVTPYGTQLLLPFSDARFAIDAMPIIDPAFTLILLVGAVVAWRRPAWRVVPATALALAAGYVGYAWTLNEAAARTAQGQLAAAQVEPVEVAAFPTVLQIHWRRVVARTPDDVYAGFVSMWRPCPIDWGVAPRPEPEAVAAWRGTREGRIFDWFTLGWVLHWRTSAGLQAADLRYGFTTDPRVSVFTAQAEMDASGAVRVSGGRTQPGRGDLSPGRLFSQAFPRDCQAVKNANMVQHTDAKPAATDA